MKSKRKILKNPKGLELNRLKGRVSKLREENKEKEKIISALDKDIASILDLKGNVSKIVPTSLDLSHTPPSGIHREGIALSIFSDAHVEEIVSPDRVLGLNKYNPEIAKKRITNYFFLLLKEINRWRKELNVSELHLMVAGDLISGNIHYALVESNSMPPVPAMMYAQELLFQGIKYLSENGNFSKIRVLCVTGNHPRITQKLTDKTRVENSLEYYCYKVLEDTFKNVLTGYNNIEFTISEGAFIHVITPYKKSYILTHGDIVRYLGGIGGLMVPATRWWFQMNKIITADKAFMAHHHTWIPQDTITINGSCIGYSEFPLSKGFSYQKPIQHLELLDSKYGFTKKVPLILE